MRAVRATVTEEAARVLAVLPGRLGISEGDALSAALLTWSRDIGRRESALQSLERALLVHGVSREELAKHAGITAESMRKVAQGHFRPSARVQAACAQALKEPVWALFPSPDGEALARLAASSAIPRRELAQRAGIATDRLDAALSGREVMPPALLRVLSRELAATAHEQGVELDEALAPYLPPPQPPRLTVSPEFAPALKRSGLSQRELSRRVGCAAPHVNTLVRGKRVPSLALAERIAAVLGEPRELLFPYTSEQEDN